ncbi:type IV secretion system protein [Geodermatophilus chilensis]|jgi:type IV secretion system protein TrbL|uniref:type IV secretion system protein n=1 Tax=Geodermatophilus chilensis TaxID=2035835 RepID=UPI001E3C24A4|nr:type IV secretion system protein [Geodermatophilus chilensis]
MADALLTGGTAAASTALLAMIDLSPISWLGDAASAAVAGAWKAAMIGLWSAGLWLLTLAFQIIDAFTTPDLSAEGPMGAVLPTTLWIGASVAVVMMFVQLTVALIRRDGQSLGRVLLGVGQFGLVWISYLGIAGALVAAAAGLSRGILQAMLDIDSLSAFDPSSSWPREVVDTTVATVLGLSSLLLLIPASFFYLVIMFVREAALIILAATAPISAGGLISDSTRTWFWKSLRWFIACLLIAPTASLVLGIGVKVSAGVVAGSGDSTTQAAGMAVVGAVMIAIGAVCPLVLFRLLAFVDPGHASGAALRQSWTDAGGLSGVLSGGGDQSVGSGAASHSGGDGRSGGEAAAEAQSSGRLAAMLGGVGAAVGAGTSLAHRAGAIGTDVLGSAGVGHPGYGLPPSEVGSSRRARGSRSWPDPDRHSDGGSTDGGSAGEPEADAGGTRAPPPPGPPPSSGGPPTGTPPQSPPAPRGGLAGWAREGTAAGGPGGAAAAETAATVAL